VINIRDEKKLFISDEYKGEQGVCGCLKEIE